MSPSSSSPLLPALLAGLLLAAPRPALALQGSAPGPGPGPVEPARPAPTADSLAGAIAALDQQLRILERRLELEAEAAEAARRSAATFTVGADGAGFRSADGAFVVRFNGYVQEDLRRPLGDEAPGVSTFMLRRVRPIVAGTMFGRYDFRLMPDFGGGTATLQDAYVEARWHDALRVRAGKFKPPVGLERLQSATALGFVERGLPTNLVPNRDLGVQLSGDVKGGVLSYAVGLFNGVPDGGSADADADRGKDVAVRLLAHPFRGAGVARLQGLGIGIAATSGTQAGTPAAPGLPSHRGPLQQSAFAFRADGQAAGTSVADGARTRLAPQGYLYAGRVGLLGEYVVTEQRVRREAATATLRTSAWQVAGSYVLTGEDASHGGVRPRTPLDPGAGSWGAVELTGRVHAIHFDPLAFPTFADPARSVRAARSWTVGVNWYLNRSVRLVADYERTRFTGGAAAGDRPDEHGLLGRVQLAF